jgi:hypothetical protein
MNSTLEPQLNDFSPAVRAQALEALIAKEMPPIAEQEIVNLHCHTFYSFNAYGYSPTALAWLAKQRGFKLIGIVDFDVLDGVEEFLNACELLGVRGSTGMETRVFVPEFATREINSPGEPGVFYYMGIGFTSGQAPLDYIRGASSGGLSGILSEVEGEVEGEVADRTPRDILADMRKRADQRNRVMVERLNAYLLPVAVDYDRDVIPLTPTGNATERHMLVAYTQAATRLFTDPIPFWAEKLKISQEQVAAQIGDAPRFQNTIRSKLMKIGGAGYTQPGPDTFPTVEEVNRLVTSCGALLCATWLDGLSAGEQAMEELLDLLIGKGVVALNIIPDRNWNIPDPELRRLKAHKLYEIVALAQKLDLPLNIGTEMNAHGQKLVDDFDAPELAPVRQAFMDGAYFIYGHTVMQRALALGYQSEWAQKHLPTRRERNDFYNRIGRLVKPGRSGLQQLKRLGSALSPTELLGRLEQRYQDTYERIS